MAAMQKRQPRNRFIFYWSETLGQVQ